MDEIQTKLSVTIIPLLGNYAIITIPVGEIDTLLTFPQVLYLELPRPLYQEEITGIAASCLSAQPYSPETFPRRNLTGKGVIAGILDSGYRFPPPGFYGFFRKIPDFNLLGISRSALMMEITVMGLEKYLFHRKN